VLAAQPYNPKLLASKQVKKAVVVKAKKGAAAKKKKQTKKKETKKTKKAKKKVVPTVEASSPKAPPHEVALSATFVGCRLHSHHVAKLASYTEAADLKYYFSESKGFFYGGSCHNCAKWPPNNDQALTKNKNHQSVHYCTPCTQDPRCEGVPNTRYFLCDSCLLTHAGGGQRVRKKKVRSSC
jgi:hypothetical protein